MLSAIKRSHRPLRFAALLCHSPQKLINTPKVYKTGNLNKLYCTQTPAEGPNITLLTNGDPDLEHKLKVLILEVDVLRQDGSLVPEDRNIKDQHWKELLILPTISARKRYLEYLFKIERKKENTQAKKEKKRLESEATKPVKAENETYEEFVSQYDLQHNNIFLRFYDTTINQMYNNRLIQAMQFGQKLVVDCGYYDQMTHRENKNCAKQLMLLFAENRGHNEPYDLHFCNANPESFLMQYLHKFIGTMYDPEFPLTFHQNSYLDAFPKEQLVYLTPHCRDELEEYDHEAVYIIGGIVDKVNNDPLSLAKAKKEGIRMAKFPLDRYLQWGAGSGKSLTLNQVGAILLDVKSTGDWKHALRHVPRRKLETEFPPKLASTRSNRQGWTPSSSINFEKLSYNRNDSNQSEKRNYDKFSHNRNDSNQSERRNYDRPSYNRNKTYNERDKRDARRVQVRSILHDDE